MYVIKRKVQVFVGYRYDGEPMKQTISTDTFEYVCERRDYAERLAKDFQATTGHKTWVEVAS